MGLLLRAAVLGGIAYFITRSLSGNPAQRRALNSGDGGSSALRDPHTREEHMWPTTPSEQSSPANAGPAI